MSTITINGVTYEGNNISVKKNRVIIDGKELDVDEKNINITVIGNIKSINADAVETISIGGDADTVKTMSGDVRIEGNVTGDVKTMSGDVRCGNIGGKVNTMSGDILQE